MSYELGFDWNRSVTTGQDCPICRTPGPHGHKVTSSTPASPVGRADYFECRNCHGVFAVPFSYPDYSEDYDFADYLRFYQEVGAGLEAMTQPLDLALSLRPAASLIDVGCGVPFVVDYARREYGLQAEGLDPSNYGRRGGESLGVDVIGELLGAGSRFDGQAFDILYSSEVIEHVEDPAAFLETLVGHLNPDGILILTTPNAENLGPHTDSLTNVSIVWPGIHHALFTPAAMERALKSAGLHHCHISTATGHIVALASRSPLSIPEQSPPSRLTPYLERDFPGLPLLEGGNLFRLLRQAVGFGSWTEAREIRDTLSARIHTDYGWDVYDMDRFVAAAANEPAPGLFAAFPYFAGCLPFYFGMVDFQSSPRNLDSAARFLKAQIEIGETLTGGDPLWWGEIAHIHQPAAFNLGMVHLVGGQVEPAIAALQQSLVSPAAGSLASLGRRSLALETTARLQLALAYAKAGRFDDSDQTFAQAMACVETEPACAYLETMANTLQSAIKALR